ncbi:hypothetical protein Bca4012_010996 [Brassica carinata]
MNCFYLTRKMPTWEVTIVLHFTWCLHCGGFGREEEDDSDAAVAAESGGVEDAHCPVHVCDSPMFFSTVHFSFTTAFFLSGLGVAKLILFAFEKELEIALTLIKYLVTVTLGCDLEPQFNEPYLATSLHDFWGHRWNLMISEILRLSVYLPIRKWRVNSSEWDMVLGISATFLVSGLAHEILFFYLMHEKPTWEVSWFFVLHGVCTAAEVVVKRKTKLVHRWSVNPAISRLVTMGFVSVTGVGLFSTEPVRNGLMERFTNEGLFLISFFKRKFLIFLGLFTGL